MAYAIFIFGAASRYRYSMLWTDPHHCPDLLDGSRQPAVNQPTMRALGVAIAGDTDSAASYGPTKRLTPLVRRQSRR